jgi:hypothetical protein
MVREWADQVMSMGLDWQTHLVWLQAVCAGFKYISTFSWHYGWMSVV